MGLSTHHLTSRFRSTEELYQIRTQRRSQARKNRLQIVHSFWNGRNARRLRLQRSPSHALKSRHSSRKLKKVSIHTKEKLFTSLSTAELSKADLDFISSTNITLAQESLAKTVVSLDLLIGQDLLSTILDHNSPVQTLPSGLILTPSIFGSIISGTSLITKKATAAEIRLSALILATPIDDHEKTNQTKEGMDTAADPFNEGTDKLKDSVNNARHRTSHASRLPSSAKDHHHTASKVLSNQGLSLEPSKPAKKSRSIWNHGYLEFRHQLRLLDENRNSTSSRKEVTSKAKKVLEKNSSKTREEVRKEATGAVKKPVSYGMMETFDARISTKSMSNTHTITPTSSDATAQMVDSLPELQQRRRMSTPWLYRHWLFKQKSPLSTSRRAGKCSRDL
ncbi:hypothetical protein Aduo_001054 [Ancylostoma duodenale]